MSDSIKTKNAIAQGFKELMEKKTFAKITVSDITSKCGLNRQTFYYHFQDKYELLNWIFYNEAIEPFVEGLSFDTWTDKLLTLLHTIRDGSRFYANALRTSYSEEFREYMHKVSSNVFVSVIEDVSGSYVVSEEDKLFIARFFAYGITGSVISWVTGGMKEPPETITAHIEKLVNDCQRLAVARYMNPETKKSTPRE